MRRFYVEFLSRSISSIKTSLGDLVQKEWKKEKEEIVSLFLGEQRLPGDMQLPLRAYQGWALLPRSPLPFVVLNW